MLTVYVDGSPQNKLSWIDVAGSWFDASRAVVPLDELFPSGQTESQSNAESAIDMTNSQQDATAAALSELKIHYTSTEVVAQVIKNTPAAGKLKAGDELVTVNGEPVTGLTMLQQAIQSNGVSKPVELVVRRNGTVMTFEITPTINPDSKKPAIGIYTGETFTFPFDVKIQLQDVGGPSAGMMLAWASTTSSHPATSPVTRTSRAPARSTRAGRSVPSAASARRCMAPATTAPTGFWRRRRIATRSPATSPAGSRCSR
jgi:Predicted secreted protein containing a PDZ domain